MAIIAMAMSAVIVNIAITTASFDFPAYKNG